MAGEVYMRERGPQEEEEEEKEEEEEEEGSGFRIHLQPVMI